MSMLGSESLPPSPPPPPHPAPLNTHFLPFYLRPLILLSQGEGGSWELGLGAAPSPSPPAEGGVPREAKRGAVGLPAGADGD